MSQGLDELLQSENWSRKDAGPLYMQLRERIERAIKSGEIKPGASLPSERVIAEMGGISRITVRKAVQDLVRDGLVVQKQGSGTSVAPLVDRVEQSLTRLTSFSEDMAVRGKVVRSEWLERGLFAPSPSEIITLGLKPHNRVARISRLRIADDVPLAIERASISDGYLPDPQNVGRSLYEHLAKRNCKPVRALQRISAVNVEREDAELLAVNEGAAGLNIERISYLPGGQVVEFTRSIYRGDAYDFVAELQISGGY